MQETVTMELLMHGKIIESKKAKLLDVRDGYAVVEGAFGEVRFDFTTGKMVGNWDFWRLSEEDRLALKKVEEVKNEMKPKCWDECKWQKVVDGTQPCGECHEGNGYQHYEKKV
jgi:hypothetical protein